MGISTGYVNRLENGHNRWNSDHVELAAAALGVSAAWLMGADSRDAGARSSPISLDAFIDAVQRNDPQAIGRAFADMIRQVPSKSTGGDPIRAKLIAAYDRRDWRTIMQLSGKLADQWG